MPTWHLDTSSLIHNGVCCELRTLNESEDDTVFLANQGGPDVVKGETGAHVTCAWGSCCCLLYAGDCLTGGLWCREEQGQGEKEMKEARAGVAGSCSRFHRVEAGQAVSCGCWG